MGGLLAALAGLAVPMVARVLIAMGFSVVTIGGMSAALLTVRTEMLSYLGQGPVEGLQLAGLAGVWIGLGFVLGACTFAVTFWGLTSSVRILGAAS